MGLGELAVSSKAAASPPGVALPTNVNCESASVPDEAVLPEAFCWLAGVEFRRRVNCSAAETAGDGVAGVSGSGTNAGAEGLDGVLVMSGPDIGPLLAELPRLLAAGPPNIGCPAGVCGCRSDCLDLACLPAPA